MQLYCGIFSAQIPPIHQKILDQFFLLIAEEELRRRPPPSIYNASEAELSKKYWDVLNIDEEIYVLPTVRALTQQLQTGHKERIQKITVLYEKILEDLGNGKSVVLSEAKEDIKDCENFNINIGVEIANIEKEETLCVTFDGKLEKNSTQAEEIIRDYEKQYQRFVIPLLMMNQLFSGPNAGPLPDNLLLLGNNDHHVVLALILQNASHVKNADRRYAIENGKYLNPFTNSNAILQRIHLNLATSAKEKYVKEILSSMTSEIANIISNYEIRFHQIYAEKRKLWELDCIALYYRMNPIKPVFHEIPECDVCTHRKPEWAGFRCICGCMSCFTSYYFDVNPNQNP